jgi:hypothetical protein
VSEASLTNQSLKVNAMGGQGRAGSGLSLREQLEKFVYRVDELQQRRLLRTNLGVGLQLNWDFAKGMSIRTEWPDEEDLRSFLVTLRQFMSQKEPVYLEKIYNLCVQHLKSEELRRAVLESQKSWKEELKRGGIRLEYDGRQFTPTEITGYWINSQYFHNDPEEFLLLQNLIPPAQVFARHIFLDHVVELTKRVLFLGDVLKVALAEGLV